MKIRLAGCVGVGWLIVGLVGCTPEPEFPTLTNIYPTELGGPVQGLSEELSVRWERGRQVFLREWKPSEGLGPLYNATGCAGCHFFPVTGGSGQRFRDQHLLQTEDSMGRHDDGTDEGGPLRKLYSTEDGHLAEPEVASVVVRRAPLSTFGVGLWSLVSDEEMLSRADPDDVDGDGISGRAAELGDGLGRFGYKAQSATLAQVVRRAWKEQAGLTSGPATLAQADLPRSSGWIPSAWAHPSNPGEDPAVDGDTVADPEVPSADVDDVITYLTWLAPPPLGQPRPDWLGDPTQIAEGRVLFGDVGCARCHVPELDSAVGPVPAYTDLLLHDMGDQLGADMAQGDAEAQEFRTSSLLAIQLYVPYLHDSSVPAFQYLGIGHGGEAAASWAAYQGLNDTGRARIGTFLESLGGWGPKGRYLAPVGSPVPDARVETGPDRTMSDFELAVWTQGREKFDRAAAPNFNSGIGTWFNADSCRACHSRPGLGGGGDNDLNVLLFDGDRAPEVGLQWPLKPGTLPRSVSERYPTFRLPEWADRVEERNSPSTFGLGELGRVPAAVILSRHDPDDTDGDGISGRARILPGGLLGRFGWKAGVPTVRDFAADALRGELSMTVDPRFTDYTIADDHDPWPDPELRDNTLAEMVFYLEHVAPPVPREPEASFEVGRQAFVSFGCDRCHAPDLGGLPAYTDLLLHDVVPDGEPLVNRDVGVLPSEFRTAPLWGAWATPPYLHDGRAETLSEAILMGHAGEAQAARDAYAGGSSGEQGALLAFLRGI